MVVALIRAVNHWRGLIMNVRSRRPRLAFAALGVTGLLALTACTGTAAEPAGEGPAASAAPVTAVAAVAEESVVQQSRLSVASATEAAEAALARCQADGLGFVTVAVVDRFGQVQALLRGDNAAVHTLEAAQAKAYTAAAFGAPTSDLAPRAVGDGATVADLPGTLFLPGGVPVKIGEATIAGIGVGGAPDGMADQACAAAGLDVLAEVAAG
jgi:uncharacterized protein GlcG (DUF336 family)